MNAKFNKEMFWRRISGFRKEYELRAEGRPISILKRKSIFSGCASGEVDGKKVKFVSKGGINRSITIKDIDTKEKIGEIDLKWYGNNNGVLKLASGKEYVWKCIDFFRGRWAWVDGENREILLFKPENLLNKSGSIDLSIENDVGLLTLLGLHLKLFFNYWIIIAVVVIIAVLRD